MNCTAEAAGGAGPARLGRVGVRARSWWFHPTLSTFSRFFTTVRHRRECGPARLRDLAPRSGICRRRVRLCRRRAGLCRVRRDLVEAERDFAESDGILSRPNETLPGPGGILSRPNETLPGPGGYAPGRVRRDACVGREPPRRGIKISTKSGCSVRLRRSQASISRVNGPSLTSSTSIIAPNFPVSTCSP